MDDKFRLDLKAAGHGREGFHELPREDLVARQHVGELPSENIANEGGEQVIAEAMPSAIGVRVLRNARAVDEIEPFVEEPLDEARHRRRFVGVVAVDQHVDIGVDIGKHPAHHVAFALPRLGAHHGARGARRLDRRIRGVVVVDVDGAGGQQLAEFSYHRGNRAFLVAARHENRDLARMPGCMTRCQARLDILPHRDVLLLVRAVGVEPTLL